MIEGITGEVTMHEAPQLPRDGHDRLAFLLQLTDHIRTLMDPVEIQETAARLLGERLGVDRVGYAELVPGEDSLRVVSEWRKPGMASMLGQYRIEPSSPGVLAVEDAANDSAWGTLDARSAIAYRLVKRDRLVAAIFVHQAQPRRWSEAEIEMVSETGERTWEAVERASAQMQLRQSEEKYRRLFDSIDEGFCIIEVLFDAGEHAVDYRFIECNAAFARKTGLKDAIGRRMRELAPAHEQHWFDVYGHVATTGESKRFELPAEALGHWYEVYAFRIGDPVERRVAVIFDDISKRVRNEAALRDSERRYRALAAEREKLLEAERVARMEADRAMRAKDEFLATLSHELRTPLSNIVTWSRLLQAQFVGNTEMLRRGLTIISDNALAQGRLISSLLDTSRIVSGKFELEPEPLDLHELLGSIHASMRPAAESKGVALSRMFEGTAAPLFADGARLRQVIENLLANAIKFTPAGGRVELSCRRVEGRFHICVEDSGEGIDAELLPQIFDRFRQADTSRTRVHGGLGLGLSIARQIVEMHGGSIQAHSDGLGKGARFTVIVPMQPEDDSAPPTATAEVTPHPAHDALDGVRILAIEDQPDMRDLLKRILEDHKARVTVVDTASEALTLLRHGPDDQSFDVLISDIGLPALDGNQLIRIVRQDLCLDATRLPAIAVTAYARFEDRQRALEAGFQEHMTKPYSVAALVALVRRLGGTRRRD
jgi:signal transduction histidine kinase/ActR/RegA family two-component response regulator